MLATFAKKPYFCSAKNGGFFRKSPRNRKERNHLRKISEEECSVIQSVANIGLSKSPHLTLKITGICEK